MIVEFSIQKRTRHQLRLLIGDFRVKIIKRQEQIQILKETLKKNKSTYEDFKDYLLVLFIINIRALKINIINLYKFK